MRSCNPAHDPSRRDFILSASALAAGGLAGVAAFPKPSIARTYSRNERLRIGVIGCGGRGTGAAVDALSSTPDVQIVALGDVFKERIDSCLGGLMGLDTPLRDRVTVGASNCFAGFDAYKGVLGAAAGGVDSVILATPPGFRPIHLAAAVAAGKHIFMEKPVAVDGPGVRSVLASAESARQKNIAIVAGTQRRHEPCYLAAMEKLAAGALGQITGARCYWNQGGLWMNPRKPEWSDMEWQLRNWLYFTWLSGDHIVEQHVHNLDVVNWALNAVPTRALGMGGRQVRTDPAYGHIFDHFAIEYEYTLAGGASGRVAGTPRSLVMTSQCRQIDGAAGRVEEVIVGTEGTLLTASGRARIEGPTPWSFTGDNGNPYVREHADLYASVRDGKPLNEGRRIAESTLTAIMGRMAAYTGKAVTWEQALNSRESLVPERPEFGPLATPPVAVPGRTQLA